MPVSIPDLNHAVVLCMDLHTSIVSIYTKGQEDNYLDRVARVQAAARQRGIPVIHVQVGFRPGLPEISDRNLLFSAIKSSSQWQQLFIGPGGAIHPRVAPQGNEIVVTKHRGSAFTGTDLEMILRAQAIDTLVLMGIATSGVVLATLLHAADADYRVAVVSDCCLDRDPEVHVCLVEKYFPLMATVVDAAAMAKAMRAN